MVNVDLDVAALTRGLNSFAMEHMPKATAAAVNTTAEDAQRAVRLNVRTVFTLRTPNSARLFERTIKIGKGDKATSARPVAVLRIQGPETITGADPIAAMLMRHEDGGTHYRSPVEPFYVPADALRPNAGTVIPRRLYPRALRIFERKTADGVLPALRGSKRRIAKQTRTFFRMGDMGIWEREGDEIQKVWHFTQRIRLKPRLRFFALGAETATSRWPINIVVALERRLVKVMR